MGFLNDMPLEVLREVVALLQFSDLLKLICTRDKRLHRHLFQRNFVKKLCINHDSTSERHIQLWMLRALRGVDEVEILHSVQGAQRIIPALAVKPLRILKISTAFHDGTSKQGVHDEMTEYFAAVRDTISQTNAPALCHIFPQLEHLHVSYDVDGLFAAIVPRKNVTSWFTRGAELGASSSPRGLALPSFFSTLPPRLQSLTMDFTKRPMQILVVPHNAFEELPRCLTKLILKSNFVDYRQRLHLAIFGQSTPNLENLEIHLPYSSTGISLQDDVLPPVDEKQTVCPFPAGLLRLSLTTTEVSTNTLLASLPPSLQTLELIGDEAAKHRLIFGQTSLFNPVLPPSITELSLRGLYLIIGGLDEWKKRDQEVQAYVILPTALQRLNCSRKDFISKSLTASYPRLTNITHISVSEGHREPSLKSFGSVNWYQMHNLYSLELTTRKLRAKHVQLLPPTLKYLKSSVENLATLLDLLQALPECRFSRMHLELRPHDLTTAYNGVALLRTLMLQEDGAGYPEDLPPTMWPQDLTPAHLLRCFSHLLERRCQVTLSFPEISSRPCVRVALAMSFDSPLKSSDGVPHDPSLMPSPPILWKTVPVTLPPYFDSVRFNQPFICSNGLIKMNSSELNPSLFFIPSLTQLEYRSLFPLHSEHIAALPRGLRIFNSLDTPICSRLDLSQLPDTLVAFTSFYQPTAPAEKRLTLEQTRSAADAAPSSSVTPGIGSNSILSSPPPQPRSANSSPSKSPFKKSSATFETLGVPAIIGTPKPSISRFEAPYLILSIADVILSLPSAIDCLHFTVPTGTMDTDVHALEMHISSQADWSLRGLVSLSGGLVPPTSHSVDSDILLTSSQDVLDPEGLHLGEAVWTLSSTLRFPHHVQRVSLNQNKLEDTIKKSALHSFLRVAKMPISIGTGIETFEYSTNSRMTLEDCLLSAPSNLKEIILNVSITGKWPTTWPRCLKVIDVNNLDVKHPLMIDLEIVPQTVQSMRLRSGCKLIPPGRINWSHPMESLHFEGGSPWTDGFVHELIGQLAPGAKIKIGTVGFTGVLADRNTRHLDWKTLLKSTVSALRPAQISTFDFALTDSVPFFLTPLTTLRSLHLKTKDAEVARVDTTEDFESRIVGVDSLKLSRIPVLPLNLVELEIENNDEYFPHHYLEDLKMLPTSNLVRLVLNLPIRLHVLGPNLPRTLITLSLPKAKSDSESLDLETLPQDLQYLSLPRIQLSYKAVLALPDKISLCVSANPDAVLASLRTTRPETAQRLEEALRRRAETLAAQTALQASPLNNSPTAKPLIRTAPSSMAAYHAPPQPMSPMPVEIPYLARSSPFPSSTYLESPPSKKYTGRTEPQTPSKFSSYTTNEDADLALEFPPLPNSQRMEVDVIDLLSDEE